MLNESECRGIARALLEARKNRAPITNPSQSCPALELSDAYRIQDFWAEAVIADGARMAGHKIGLTSKAMQRTAGISEPDFGKIFSNAVHGDGVRLEASSFIKPRVEMELAFVMGDDLEGPGVYPHDVLRATEYVVPALEINDFRTHMPRTIMDTIADNAAFAAIVLGGTSVRPCEVNLRWIGAALSRNGIIEESGLSVAVMGHPAASVAWLANKLHVLGGRLEKGQIVLAGSFTRPVDLAAGDVVHADYGSLGSIGLSFV
jgi:2-oxo-hept-3-ene-1,7-dioate hydratase